MLNRFEKIYLVGTLGVCLAIAAVGGVPDVSSELTHSPVIASALRTVISLPLPLAIAVLLRADLSKSLTWAFILVATVTLTVKDHAFMTLILAVALAVASLPLFKILKGERDDKMRQMSRAQGWVWSLALAGVGCGFRLLTLNEPFERDLMVYAMVASGWLEGLSLYAGVWDHKPPALYMPYAAAIAVFGQTPVAIWALGCSMFVITLFGVKATAEHLAPPAVRTATGVLACLVWTIGGSDLLLQANQPNVEVFMNTCLIWALVFLLKTAENMQRWTNLIAAGVLFFAASAFKQIAVFPAALAGVWLVFLAAIIPAGQPSLQTRIFRVGLPRLFVLGAIGIIGWALVFAGFYFAGTFDEFYYATFTYNQAYSSSVLLNILEVPHVTTAQPYYYALSFVFLLLHMQRSRDPRHALLFLMYLGTLMMVAAPGNYFPHYFQLLLPILAVSASFFFAIIFSGRRQILAALVLLAPVWVSFGYATSPERVAFVKYGRSDHGGDSYVTKQIGLLLSGEEWKDKTIFHWGAEPGVYFWSGRPSLYRFPFNWPLFFGPRAEEMTLGLLAQISCTPPDIVVINTVAGGKGPIWGLLTEFYDPAADLPPFNRYEIWQSNGRVPPCSR